MNINYIVTKCNLKFVSIQKTHTNKSISLFNIIWPKSRFNNLNFKIPFLYLCFPFKSSISFYVRQERKRKDERKRKKEKNISLYIISLFKLLPDVRCQYGYVGMCKVFFWMSKENLNISQLVLRSWLEYALSSISVVRRFRD